MRKIPIGLIYEEKELYGKLNAFYGKTLDTALFRKVYRHMEEKIDIKAGYAEACGPGFCRGSLAALYTIGRDAEAYSGQCFADGEAAMGFLADMMANEYMFRLGDIVFSHIKAIMKCENINRLDPFNDLSPHFQKMIADTIDIGVTCNDRYVLDPAKSASFIAVYGEPSNKTEKIQKCCVCIYKAGCMYKLR